MPENESPANETQAVTDATSQADTTAASGAATAQTSQAEAERIDPEILKKLQSELAEARKEAAKYRTTAKKYEDEKLTESERLQKQAEEQAARAEALATELRQERSKAAVAEVAAELDLNFKLASPHLTPTFNDDGSVDVKALRQAATALLKEFPQLAKSYAAPTSAATNGARGGTQVDGDTAALLSHIRTGGGGNPFDPQFARQHGGGVTVSERGLHD